MAMAAALAVPRPAAADHQCAQWKDTNVAFAIDYSASMAGWRADLAESFATQIFGTLDNNNNLSRVGWVAFPAPVTNIPLGAASHGAVWDALRNTPSNRSEGSPYGVIEDAANDMAALPTSELNVLIVILDAEDWGQWDVTGVESLDAEEALRDNGAWNYIVYAGNSPGSAGALDAESLAAFSDSEFAFTSSVGAVQTLVDRVRQEACISTLPHLPIASFSILRDDGGSLVADNDLLLGTEGFQLIFDGSTSSDSEDANVDLHYEWVFDRPDDTVDSFSGSGVAGMTPRFQFDDEWLPFGTVHTVTLRVTDSDGNVSEPVSQDFAVIGSPPNIVIEGAFDVDVGQGQFIWVRYQGAGAPNTDIDGGQVSHVLEIVQAPPRGMPAQGTTSPVNGAVDRQTTQGDIGQWIITATATDNEGDTDTATASFIVRNKPLELSLLGTDQVDVDDTVVVESSLVDDPDNPNGGGLTFDWQVIQAPVGADPNLMTLLANAPSISFTTTDAEAGTYIFRLIATDDEPDPWTETAEAEFTVLVNAPPVAKISGGSPVGSLSIPATLLSAIDSSDPDTDRTHHRADNGTPQGISQGVMEYAWTLLNTPGELQSDFPPGNVEDVLGVSGQDADLHTPNLDPGDWTFQVEVTDAEGSTDSATFTVEVIDEGGPPFAIVTPPAERYIVDAANAISIDIPFSGVASLDLDNAITGIPLPGIDDYTWGVMVAPPGCSTVPPEPSGPDADSFTLATGGSVIDLACQGYWQIGLTVTDDDAEPKQATETAIAVIGNCPEPICIDYPTTAFPRVIDFVEGTDILIYYHLDSALYGHPILAGGLFTYLEIFHENEPTIPFKTGYDANPLPSGFGGHLIFQWDGYGDNGQRPLPGRYDVHINLADSVLGNIGIQAVEHQSIFIATTEPEILESSTRYINHRDLADGGAVIDIDYQLFGTAEMDELRWRVIDRAGTVLVEDQLSDFSFGAFVWDGHIGPSIADPEVYEIELEALRGGASLGVSDRHRVVVYSLALEHSADDLKEANRDPIVLINDDDDNVNGVADKDDVGTIPQEDDLSQVVLYVEPKDVPEAVILASRGGDSFLRVWDAENRSALIVPDRVYDLNHDVFPNAVWIEGMSPGLAKLAWRLEDPAGVLIEEIEIDLHIITLDIDIDADMDGDIDIADEIIEEDQDFPPIIYVNNDDDTVGGFVFLGTDSEDSILDGRDDVEDLTPLIVRHSPYIPPGTRLELTVQADGKIRIFDETLVAVIDPRASGVDPDLLIFDVPLDKIANGDLNYWIEGIDHISEQHLGNHGLISLSLQAPNPNALFLDDDFFVETNIFQNPPASGDTSYRNYVQARRPLKGVLGIEAALSGPEPIITWDQFPDSAAFSSYWVGIEAEDLPIEDRAADRWLQTGVQEVFWSDGGLYIRRFFEVVTDMPGFESGENPLGYQVFNQPLHHWTHGTFSLEIDPDGLIPLVSVSYNGKVWKSVLSAGHTGKEFSTYTIAAETNQSISRVPGTPASPAQVRGALFKDRFGWHPWSLEPGDINVIWTDAKGDTKILPTTAVPRFQHDFGFGFEWKGFQAFDFWDERPQ